jgi:hypothetical protein
MTDCNVTHIGKRVFCESHGAGTITAVCSSGRESGMPLIKFDDGIYRAGGGPFRAMAAGMKELCDQWEFTKEELV